MPATTHPKVPVDDGQSCSRELFVEETLHIRVIERDRMPWYIRDIRFWQWHRDRDVVFRAMLRRSVVAPVEIRVTARGRRR
jgi:hypothetical protein